MIASKSKQMLIRSFEKTAYTFKEKPIYRLSRNFGIYIHVPFCLSKCSFCSFYKEIYSEEMKQRYLQGVKREILESHMEGNSNWIYIGGGTPNTLSIKELRDYIVSPLREKVQFDTLGIELLPSLLSKDYLSELKSAGFTKISMGIESFDNKVIELTGRKTGNGKTIIDLIRFAKSIGLFVSVDMMAGLPGQTDSSFLSDIKKSASLSPDQIITYPYMILRGTENRSGLEDHKQFELIEQAHQILGSSGYKRACVWTSQKGTDYYDSSRDELVEDYIGFGPAAFSTFGGWKIVNPELAPYLKSMSNCRQMAFVAQKDPSTDMWRKFARMIYDLRCECSADLPFYINLLIRLLKISGYSTNDLLNSKGKLFANEITKTVVETLPFPIQNKSIVSNYREYLEYKTSNPSFSTPPDEN